MILDIWRVNQLVFVLMLLCISPYLFKPKVPLFLILGALYSLLSPLLVFQGLNSPYQDFQVRIDATSAKAFAHNLLVIPLFFLPLTSRRLLIHLIHLLITANSFWCLFHDYGIFGNYSMDGVAIALVLPSLFAIHTPYIAFDLLKRALPLIALILNPGTTPLLCLGVAAVYHLIHIKRTPQAIFLGSLILLAGLVHVGPKELINPSDRFEKWSLFMSWWWDYGKHLLGTGLGSFEWLGFVIQGQPKHNQFLMMHNEYLQVLFEGGVIGLTLFLTGFVFTLKKSKETHWLFLTWIMAGITFLTQYPLRFMILQTFLVLMLAETWKGKEEQNS